MKHIYLLLLLFFIANISTAQTYYIAGGYQPGSPSVSGSGIACPGSTVQYGFINNSGIATAYKWRITKGTSGGQTIICNSSTINVTWANDLNTDGKLEVFKVNLCSDDITGSPLATLTLRKYKYPPGIGSSSTDDCAAPRAQLLCSTPQDVTFTFWLSDTNTDYSSNNWAAVNNGNTISLPTNWTVKSIARYQKSSCIGLDYERVAIKVHTDGIHAGDVKFRVTADCGSYGDWTVATAEFPAIDLTQSNPVKIFCNSTSSNTVTVSSALATSYNWTVPAGYLINGTATNLTTTSNTVTITSPTATANGTVTVTGLSACGTSSPVSIPLYYGPQIPGPVTLAVNHPPKRFSLSVSGVPGATSYKWYVNNVLKATTTETLVTLPIAGNLACNTGYYFGVEAVGQCGTSEQSYIYWFDPLECGSSASATTISIYPNPSSQSLNIAYTPLASAAKNVTQPTSNLEAAEPINFSAILYDDKGKVIRSSDNNKRLITMDTRDIPNGIYYIHIKNGSNTIRKQVIIKH